MPRNGSGTASIPNSLVNGTTVDVGPLNANFSDIASELTNSLPIDGQAGMTGQLKAANGSVGAPGITFTSDLDSGLYRIGGDNIGFSIGGTKLLDLASGALGVTGALSAASLALTADLPISEGGTGQSTAAAAFDALAPTRSRGDIIARGASSNARLAIGAADTLLKSDGTDLSYGKIAAANVTDGVLTHAKLASGVTASQANMESGSATDTFVTPGRQHFHPGHPKGGGYITGGGTPVLTSSYNITGISDVGVGICDVAIANDMADANYWVVATVENANSDLATGEAAGVYVTSKAAGGFTLVGEDGDEDGASGDQADWFACSFAIFGDMP